MDSIKRIREDSNSKLRIRVRSGPRIRANSGRIRIRANSCEFEPASLPLHRGQQQVRGGARGAQFHGNRPREGRGPGDPHGQGRPHPHQRPRAASRLLPVGGTGGVLGRHTNVCNGTRPRWETPGGHRRRHQHLHRCHHQPGHGALPSGLGALRPQQAARRT